MDATKIGLTLITAGKYLCVLIRLLMSLPTCSSQKPLNASKHLIGGLKSISMQIHTRPLNSACCVLQAVLLPEQLTFCSTLLYSTQWAQVSSCSGFLLRSSAMVGVYLSLSYSISCLLMYCHCAGRRLLGMGRRTKLIAITLSMFTLDLPNIQQLNNPRLYGWLRINGSFE